MIYVASSWRNQHYPQVIEAIRDAGLPFYDFRNPLPGSYGFSWREIAPDFEQWDPETYVRALDHPIAQAGFQNDFSAMCAATCGVLVLPSGRSSHLEAGWIVGRGLPLYVYLPEPVEPELMYLIAGPPGRICLTLDALIERLRERYRAQRAAG